jgi:hypothetical protein
MERGGLLVDLDIEDAISLVDQIDLFGRCYKDQPESTLR